MLFSIIVLKKRNRKKSSLHILQNVSFCVLRKTDSLMVLGEKAGEYILRTRFQYDPNPINRTGLWIGLTVIEDYS